MTRPHLADPAATLPAAAPARVETRPAAATAGAGHHRAERLLMASGVVAAALYVAAAALFVGAIIPRMPPMGAPAAERAAFYATMAHSVAYRSISYLGALQMAFLLPFFGGLLGVLRRAERGGEAVSFSVFAAGVLLAVITPFAILIEDHLMLGFAAAGVDSVTVAAVDGMVPLSFALSAFPQAVVLAGTAVVLRGDPRVPRWVGRFGLGVAALSLAGTGTLVTGALFPVSHLASLFTRVWLLALGLALLRRGGER